MPKKYEYSLKGLPGAEGVEFWFTSKGARKKFLKFLEVKLRGYNMWVEKNNYDKCVELPQSTKGPSIAGKNITGLTLITVTIKESD